MFSHHPFTLEHRYSLGAVPVLPMWKRAFDIVGCLAALPMLGLLGGVFALLAVGRSRGPVFYRQQHVGAMGRSVRVYRFRTMRASLNPRHDSAKLSEHSLLLPGGRFLRASGLVDLPQIVNVLRGEMSIVGPRPCPATPNDARLSGPRNHLHVVPGITGAWRLAGETPSGGDEVARWEATYAERMSFGADFGIIVRTVFAALFSRR
jgi:lipopolysaccharide/colanic/teichoic acid biosynthesis glycosyltransferase